ncbi:site-specific integrase [Pseudomonas sp. TH03]|uniref:site-specific integrase n=1 Tax=Pseudomonas sp. TH03 TaxID=2796369 RepID=UPI001912B767|nr:site-specific integrase [Pseudomonas sp. TH03]MBK5551884.1 site-specific integrase [Pseudomonas sp. TH03]
MTTTYRRLNIRELYITDKFVEGSISKSITHPIHIDNSESSGYHWNRDEVEPYYHFPVILNPDNTLWSDGNLYLLSLISSIEPIDNKTLRLIANDLVIFKRTLNSYNIDYRIFPSRPISRPTYFFRSILSRQIKEETCAPSTAARRMRNVIGFYIWMLNQHHFKPSHELWKEKLVSYAYIDDYGFRHTKQRLSYDIAIKVPKNNPSLTGKIRDGGVLTPIESDIQKTLISSLFEIANPEMIFIFLLALVTGARIQTLLTLPPVNFSEVIDDGRKKVAIPVGRGKGADTKKDKRLAIYVPTWLYKKIQTYLCSQRYTERKNEYLLTSGASSEGYVFLNRNGSPYYMRKRDKSRKHYKNVPEGQGVRSFLAQQLIPEIQKKHKDFKFRFHDLRATFGMNLVEQKWKEFEYRPEALNLILDIVREALGHTNVKTTLEYLNARRYQQLIYQTQSDFETYLENRMESTDFE